MSWTKQVLFVGLLTAAIYSIVTWKWKLPAKIASNPMYKDNIQARWAPMDLMDERYVKAFEEHFPILPNENANAPNLLVEPKDGCHWPEGLIAVKVRRNDFVHRNRLRSNNAMMGVTNVLFFLGAAPDGEDPEVNSQLLEEISEHDDIVIGDFPDNYKHIRAKEWFKIWYFSERCQGRGLWSMDDDAMFNLEKMAENLYEVVCYQNLYSRAKPYRKGGKWNISVEDYKLDRYPPYCDGKGYGISRDAADRIVKEGLRRDWNWKNGTCGDTFITGVLRILARVHIDKVTNALKAFGNKRRNFENALEKYGTLFKRYREIEEKDWNHAAPNDKKEFSETDVRMIVWAVETKNKATQFRNTIIWGDDHIRNVDKLANTI